MTSFVLSIPALSATLATAPTILVRARRRVVAQSHRTVVLGRRYVRRQAYTAFYTAASAIIPDDAYDWEDEYVAEFLEEDITA